MSESDRTILICSCEDTMPLDGETIARGCRGATVKAGRHLCRSQLAAFETLLAQTDDLTVACTQEAPLFGEVAQEKGFAGKLAFANVRETAGWSKEAKEAAPKMAALLAAAAEPVPPPALVSLESAGVILIYGRDEVAVEAGRKLADRLDVTVLLSKPGDVARPYGIDFPILKGTIRTATGHLGAFDLIVDDFAEPAPSSRATLAFGEPRKGAKSRADIVLDLSGGAPLFPAHDLRSGYLRADPSDRAAVAEAIFAASGLDGVFDKPRFIDFHPHLCAHSRSQITGCTRCLDLCPTGAITPSGDHVAISAEICAGCGACAAVCPTGAASYALPPADALMRKLRTLLTAYHEAGGKDAVVLLHDEDHGAPLIDALARHGDGLPANVLPLAINEVTQTGIEAVAAVLAYGATALRFLTRAKPKHDIESLSRTVTLANMLAEALGYGPERAATIETDDPDQLLAALRAIEPGGKRPLPATFMPVGDKRSVAKLALRALHEAAPAPTDIIALAEKAPFGAVKVETEGCTLCLACVSACPTGALSDDPDRPTLAFSEDACVQCGLCAATCPEKVITLEPRLNFSAINAPPVMLKQEEPFHCTSCGKPFGTKSSIERIIAKLEGKHWMFSGSEAGAARLQALKMCDDCRVTAVTNAGIDPYAGPTRPAARTTEDYLRERERAKGREGPV